MAAADARGLHRARGRKVRGPERDAVHARGGGRDRLDVLHALGGLQDRVDQDRARHLVARLELRQQLVEIVDVPRPLDLGQHHHVELVAGRCDDLRDVVERPGRVERIDAGPQAGGAEVVRARHLDEAGARRLLGVGRESRPPGCRAPRRPRGSGRRPWRGSSPRAAARSGSCARAAPAAPGTASGAPIASGLKKGRGSFMGVVSSAGSGSCKTRPLDVRMANPRPDACSTRDGRVDCRPATAAGRLDRSGTARPCSTSSISRLPFFGLIFLGLCLRQAQADPGYRARVDELLPHLRVAAVPVLPRAGADAARAAQQSALHRRHDAGDRHDVRARVPDRLAVPPPHGRGDDRRPVGRLRQYRLHGAGARARDARAGRERAGRADLLLRHAAAVRAWCRS